MLIRRSAVPLTAALLLGLAPPLTGDASATAAPRWQNRLVADYLAAQRVTRGDDVKIALLSDGVARGVKVLDGALAKGGRDFVGSWGTHGRHGTLLASLLVGSGSSSGSLLTMRGLVPGATLMPVRIHPTPGEPSANAWFDKDKLGETIARGIRHAADNGAQVIAVELWESDGGWSGRGTMIASAVEYARRKNAIIVGVGSKFDGSSFTPVPVGLPGVLGVGVVGENGRRDTEFADPSTANLVAAPGTKHPGIGPGNRGYLFWGPSPALVWGTAVAAMVKSEYPKLTPTQVIEAITTSARHPKGKGRYDTDLGYGYLNPKGALDAAGKIAERRDPPPPPPPVVQDSAYFGGAEPPGPVRAVPYDPAILGGFGGLIFAGLLAVIAALVLGIRRPRPKPSEPQEPEMPAPPSPSPATPS